MRRLTVLACAALAAAPVPALAQDGETGELSARLSDPATQTELAETLAVMSEVLLDLPLAPMAEAAAEMAGKDPARVDPDMTLRKMAPGAGVVPDQIADKLPRMMDGMAGMASGMEAMMPALRTMADRMEASMAKLRQREMHR